ncbi:MoxR family ATPase [Christensenellaceae bacterium OttesenSCG-928-M15]|nr:MoxR family ATPase [Christensenellaceae bacterium OttesenSCG-928-M15]
MERAVRIMQEVSKALIGKNEVIGKVMLAILAKGHILLEDKPGVGKTTLALAFSKALALDYRRVQFTPDVLPSDITGFTIYNKQTGAMEYQKGAILSSLFLADEINRANTRTQSALLEAMEENKVTVDGVTHALPSPFTVIATQNPSGAQGTQLLPDSQLDRFMVRLSIGYPAVNDEVDMLKAKMAYDALEHVNEVADGRVLMSMQEQVKNVYINEKLYEYIVALVASTRNHPLIDQGASPRASIALMRMGQAYAFLNGRDYMVPQDIKRVFFDVVPHRLLLSHKARSQAVHADAVAEEILNAIKTPGVSRAAV